MSDDDQLFQVKNHFYLGKFQLAVNEATQTVCGDDQVGLAPPSLRQCMCIAPCA